MTNEYTALLNYTPQLYNPNHDEDTRHYSPFPRSTIRDYFSQERELCGLYRQAFDYSNFAYAEYNSACSAYDDSKAQALYREYMQAVHDSDECFSDWRDMRSHFYYDAKQYIRAIVAQL